MRSQPGRLPMAARSTGLPHHEARMISGSRRITSAGSTTRSVADGLSRSSEKMSRPPASSMISETQRTPAMSGSCHSSKYTRGRSGHTLENSRTCRISCLAIEAEETTHHDDDVEHIIQRARIGAEDREAGSDQLGTDLGLEVREG